jgi:iron complex outermembrane receptor protein
MRKIALVSAMLLYMHMAFAQTTIRGKISDLSTNSPLYGATISVSGKNLTTTDKSGSFSINCTGAVTMTISYVGFESQKIKADCGNDINVQLKAGENTLDNVEISATSSENKNLLYQPASITKLGNHELKRNLGLFLDDAIQTSVPGVTMNRRSVSGGQQFNIRGYGNGSRGTRGISSNFDGQGYKVYLNGIPVTDAEGITTLDDIDYGSIGNVEIVKGPAGTLYGQAISGAINFRINPAIKGRTSIEQQTIFGNYGLQRYTTLLQAGGERSSVLLSYGKQKSDGFSNHNASHKDFVNFVGDFNPNEKQAISVFVGYTDSYDERLGELTLAQWQNKDYSGNIEYIKRNGHSHVSTFRAGVSHMYQFNSHISNTTSVFGMGFRSDASSAGGWTDKTSVNYGLRTSFDTKFNVGNGATLSGKRD